MFDCSSLSFSSNGTDKPVASIKPTNAKRGKVFISTSFSRMIKSEIVLLLYVYVLDFKRIGTCLERSGDQWLASQNKHIKYDH